jgi:hypothetical protein
MATIHVLKPTSEPRTAAPPPNRSAEIIFFPGVRYERWEATPIVTLKPKKKRRSRVKRDRMSIVI